MDKVVQICILLVLLFLPDATEHKDVVLLVVHDQAISGLLALEWGVKGGQVREAGIVGSHFRLLVKRLYRSGDKGVSAFERIVSRLALELLLIKCDCLSSSNQFGEVLLPKESIDLLASIVRHLDTICKPHLGEV